MKKRLNWTQVFVIFALLALVGLAVFYILTMPTIITARQLPKDYKGDPKKGEYMFYAGGCASCHARPASAKCTDPRYKDSHDLTGGRCLHTPFGTFYAPNITPDKETGIGAWSTAQFVTAMKKGVAPDGSHYYPAFPYTSYQHMTIRDLIDLKAFLDRLPAKKARNIAHDLPLPFRLRRGLGLWKLLYLDGKTFTPDPAKSAAVNRGAYLVNGPGHCGECHSPRNLIGGFISGEELSGAKNPDGEGVIPNLTPHKYGLKSWSASDIAYGLKTGFTPEFDSFGGSMVKVQQNMAKLTDADRAAIAAYLKSLPPRPGLYHKKK